MKNEWDTFLKDAEIFGANKDAPREFVMLDGGSSVGKSTLSKMLKTIGVLKPEAVMITPELVREVHPELKARCINTAS